MQGFDWGNPYNSARIPVFGSNICATSHPAAAQAGLQIMRSGGNAVDAALAASAVLCLVEGVSTALGGDAFAIVWDGKQLHGLDACGPAPAAWNVDYFKRRHGLDGDGLARRPRRGWDSVTVPGAIAGWGALHDRLGKLPFLDVMAPAIELAERGFAMVPTVRARWLGELDELRDQPGFAQAHLPLGRVPEVGEIMTVPGAARTLRRIGECGARDFYEGELAERIAAFSRKGDGALTLSDLRDYQPEWVTPISKGYRGYTLHELPPSGQGVAALMALGITSHFDLATLQPDSVEAQHILIEATKLAFADLHQYVADPRSMTVSVEQLLDDAYLAERARQIRLDQASHPAAGRPDSGGTVYIATADQQGMMVSFIQSGYMGFGSGVVVPETGICMQNRGVGFSMDPQSPNVVAGGKRPFHTIIPAFLTRAGQPVMSFGVMGGDIQPQGHLQALVRMIDHGQQPQAACDAPRWKLGRNLALDLEEGMAPELVSGLRKLGHRIGHASMPSLKAGAGQFIWKEQGQEQVAYVAASDWRRDGQAAGF